MLIPEATSVGCRWARSCGLYFVVLLSTASEIDSLMCVVAHKLKQLCDVKGSCRDVLSQVAFAVHAVPESGLG